MEHVPERSTLYLDAVAYLPVLLKLELGVLSALAPGSVDLASGWERLAVALSDRGRMAMRCRCGRLPARQRDLREGKRAWRTVD